jgi:hypothetical protein
MSQVVENQTLLDSSHQDVLMIILTSPIRYRRMINHQTSLGNMQAASFIRHLTKSAFFKEMLRGLRRFTTQSARSQLDSSSRRIIVLDDVPPESNAMLQALYSRSPESVVEHLKKVKSVGPERFMKSYYVG